MLALSALDIALWDLKARRANLPLFRLLGGFDARVPCYAGGIDLDLSVEALLEQTDDNLAKGFLCVIQMKVGRPDLAFDVTRVQAMRKHLGNGFPLMADANMNGRSRKPSAPHGRRNPTTSPGWKSPSLPDDIAGSRPHHGCRRRADRGRRKPALALEFKNYAACAVSYLSPTSPIAAASRPL